MDELIAVLCIWKAILKGKVSLNDQKRAPDGVLNVNVLSSKGEHTARRGRRNDGVVAGCNDVWDAAVGRCPDVGGGRVRSGRSRDKRLCSGRWYVNLRRGWLGSWGNDNGHGGLDDSSSGETL